MHGRVHDFVVINTVKKGASYPTGNSGGAPVREFVANWMELKNQPVFERVLDIGSLNINGNMYDYNFCDAGPKWRDLIGLKAFIGLDLIDGPGVTMVGNAHDMELVSDWFDLVLCLSVLEHDTDPGATLKEAYRVLKKGQPLILTTVDETHPEHKHLGGGDTETYNFIKEEKLFIWLVQAGFDKKKIKVLHIESDLMVYAIK
jgi:SAM-dependent methyltransferase